MYAGTGHLNGDGSDEWYPEWWEFDPATNGWSQKADFPGIASNNNIGLSKNGYGYYIGGYLGWGDMCSEVWQYDPNNDVWVQMADYPFSSRRWAVKAKIGDRCYIGMGTNGTNFGDFWEFDALAGVEEFTVEKFNAFPTLADEFVNFVSENINDYEVLVYNLQGKKVASISTISGSARLERSGLASGTYIYHVVLNGEVAHSERFVFK